MKRGAATAVAILLGAALWSAGPAGASATQAGASAIPAGASPDATSWWLQTARAPSTARVATLDAVSCPAHGICTAVGYSSDRTYSAGATLAEHLDGGKWTIQPTPHQAGGGLAELNGVSCPALTDCIAIGNSALGPLGEQWDGTNWTIQSMPIPAGTFNPQPQAVSCASTVSCTAVGVTYTSVGENAMPLAEYWDGTSWTAETVPVPAGAFDIDLTGVSCPTATDCTAVGTYDGTAGGDPLAEQWNGSTWTVQATPGHSGASLGSVSCVSPTVCIATGYNKGPSADRWNGTTWTKTSPPAAGDLLGRVSCATATSCFALGGAVVEHWNGANWTTQPLPIPAYAASHFGLGGLSCRPGSYCTAVGSALRKKLLIFHN
jgi:hypothetical protein